MALPSSACFQHASSITHARSRLWCSCDDAIAVLVNKLLEGIVILQSIIVQYQ
jgi:hypothetical protein